jgi:excisionase family DNA binding protein
VEQLLTKTEVREILGIGICKMDDLVRDKKIVYHKIGSSVRFKPSDVESYLQSCRIVPQPLVGGTYRKRRV